MELCVLDGTAFFMAHESVALRGTLSLTYRGEYPVTLTINGRRHRFEGGVCTIRAADLLIGSNVCEVNTQSGTIPCEGLIYKGGFISPAGITAKAYVLDLYHKVKTLTEKNQQLTDRVTELEKLESEDDIFAI